MKIDKEGYIASCPVCASVKGHPIKPTEFLQPMANPTAPWKEISMDFIEWLESSGNTVIWVVTDLFSKQLHFITCPKIPSA